MVTLLPQPRNLELKSGTFRLPDSGYLVLDVPRPADLLFTANRAKQALADYAGVHLEISGSRNLPAVIRLVLNPALRHAESYKLTIDDDGIYIAGKDAVGVF